MRRMFVADIQQLASSYPTAYFSHAAELAAASAPVHIIDSESSAAPGSQQADLSRRPFVGWGGQAIPESGACRVPWFGRARGKGPTHRPRAHPRGTEGADMATDAGPSSTTSGGSSAAAHALSLFKNPADALSVEDAVALVRRAPKGESLPERLLRGLYHFDSRAVALLLKDLSRAGLDGAAIELFDWLRELPERHLLRGLCDVYTYTAMISLCIYQQNVERALELVNEMRSRGIERNVHTYTALMNVCIKCGKHSLALDVFKSMRSAECVPNVVTYNTLVDVYGKLGLWEKAVGVLKMMKAEGVSPVLRTYNTLIIACNMCNQPREALGVYQQMCAEGFAPNSTTYNALISGYGKLGQLDKVLEVYQDMVYKGLERSVITYSSLISACEKAGRWQTALQLFEEMKREGCTPNTVTYNSLITACAQGAQWEKASGVFEAMQAQGCTPDVVTYTALISALERGGQWQTALQAFQTMCVQGCRPDAIVYNAIIDALWETGVTWAQNRALQLYRVAVAQGQFPQPATTRGAGRWELNLHALTAGVAMLSLYNWLQEIRHQSVVAGERSLPAVLAIITDAGSASKEQGNFIVKEAVCAMMSFWGAPFRQVQDNTYGGVLEGAGAQVAHWVTSGAFKAQMSSLYPITDNSRGPPDAQLLLPPPDDAGFGREYATRAQCAEAFMSVQQFERTHCLALQNMGLNYLQQRVKLVSQMLDWGARLGLRDEVVHDAVLLLDRTMSSASNVALNLLPLVGAAALKVCYCQNDAAEKQPTLAELENVTEMSASAIGEMEWSMQQLLGDDTSAISAMRCLKIYLERMGYRSLDRQGIYGIAGLPIMLVVESLFDVSLLNCRPSVVAAAILYAERRCRGAIPFWPNMLAKMTGYEDLSTPELAVAVRTAQKLCRKILYTQIYKAQATSLHSSTQQTTNSTDPLSALSNSVGSVHSTSSGNAGTHNSGPQSLRHSRSDNATLGLDEASAESLTRAVERLSTLSLDSDAAHLTDMSVGAAAGADRILFNMTPLVMPNGLGGGMLHDTVGSSRGLFSAAADRGSGLMPPASQSAAVRGYDFGGGGAAPGGGGSAALDRRF